MRAAYHSEYRPGAADTSELDPCIAAETRLKKSAFSTSKARTLFMIGAMVVVCIIFIILLLVFLTGSSAKPSNIHKVGDYDYEELGSATGDREPAPDTTTTTTVVKTDRPTPPSTTTTTRRPSVTSRPTASRLQPKDEQKGRVVVIGRDEGQPQQIQQRVNLPVEIPTAPVTTSSTTTTTEAQKTKTSTTSTTVTTTRPTMRTTRPSSVFPTAPLVETALYERRTETIKESCMDHALAALGSGVYRIRPAGEGEPFDVYCRMDVDDVVGDAESVYRAGGAWTYIQSLAEESYFYNRTFAEYQAGFGRVDRSHWLGLDAMHRIAPGTKDEMPMTLRIELYGDHCAEPTKCSDRPDGFWWGEWDFGLGSEADIYRLHITPARFGNLTSHDRMDGFYSMNNGQPFTANDRDHDIDSVNNCGQFRNYGGWWHKDCTKVALNGLYGDNFSKLRYQVWLRLKIPGDNLEYHIHPKRSIMMVRPRQ